MNNSDTTSNRDTTEYRRSNQFPCWIWGVYAALFVVSVPWYIPASAPLRIWLGLPHWVVISLLAYLCVAGFTVFVVQRLWPEQPPPDS